MNFGFLGISKTVKTVPYHHFDLNYIAKFGLRGDRTRLREQLILSWDPDNETSQTETSLNYLPELILLQELKDKYPVLLQTSHTSSICTDWNATVKETYKSTASLAPEILLMFSFGSCVH